MLFVAEKTAALEVVYDRLRKAGLDALCLEIHSRKANKKTVIKSLEQALRFSATLQPDADIAAKLATRRDELNRWANALHKPIGQSGLTGFEVIGRQVKLRAEGVRLLEGQLDDAANWAKTKRSSLEVAVDRAAAAILSLRATPKDHVWFGTNIEAQSPFDLDRLAPILSAAIEKIDLLEKELGNVIAAIDQDAVPSVGIALAAVRALRHVAAVPQQTRCVLSNSAWTQDFNNLEKAIEEGEKLAASINKVENIFRPEAWNCDTGNLLLALRADGGSLFRRMGSRYRRAKTELRALCRDKPPKSLGERIALVEQVQKGQESRKRFINRSSLLAAALGSIWAEQNTHWSEARKLAAWTWVAMLELGGSRLLTFAARTKDLAVYSAFADKLESAITAAQVAFAEVQKFVRPSLPVVFGAQAYEAVPLRTLLSKIKSWRTIWRLLMIGLWRVTQLSIFDQRVSALLQMDWLVEQFHRKRLDQLPNY